MLDTCTPKRISLIRITFTWIHVCTRLRKSLIEFQACAIATTLVINGISKSFLFRRETRIVSATRYKTASLQSISTVTITPHLTPFTSLYNRKCRKIVTPINPVRFRTSLRINVVNVEITRTFTSFTPYL